MTERAAAYVGPIYLFACLTLGGSAQGIWTNLLLQLLAILMIANFFLSGRGLNGKPAKRLGWIIAGGLALALLQLVPLPPGIWVSLPGREPVVEGFELLSSRAPWLPISMAPEATISALLACLPGLAMLLWTLGRPSAARPLAMAVIAAAFISVVIGMMQIYLGPQWYPYRFSSVGATTGLFANSNHMAALLLCSIPLLAAIAADEWRLPERKKDDRQRVSVTIALVICTMALAAGIIANGSLAVILLGGPMLAGSALIFLPAVSIRPGRLALLVLAAGIAGVAVLAGIGPDRLLELGGAASATERLEILRSSLGLAFTYAPVGSGLGTFPAVYALHEDPGLVTWTYVNHAHNDFLELIVELGLAGTILLLAVLIWVGWRFVALWVSGETPPLVRAATLVALGLLLHSVVDFPLRTAGLSALFAAALGLMAARRWSSRPRGEGRPRHLTLEELPR